MAERRSRDPLDLAAELWELTLSAPLSPAGACCPQEWHRWLSAREDVLGELCSHPVPAGDQGRLLEVLAGVRAAEARAWQALCDELAALRARLAGLRLACQASAEYAGHEKDPRAGPRQEGGG